MKGAVQEPGLVRDNQPYPDIPFIGRWHYSRAEMIADGIV
ncbi:hemolysin III family protein, partial [Mesorhizobium sp. M7A.F.Ca.CA.004.11.2.1]